jgi:CBS domain-containing protein
MRELQVRDVMVCKVLTLRPGDSVTCAITLLVEHQLGGAPVVDEDGNLVGLLSDVDIVVRQGRLHFPSAFTLFSERREQFPPPSLSRLELELRKTLGSTVVELMDPNPPVCFEGDSIEDVATRMVELGARRLPVVRGRRLVGILAREDLLRLLIPEAEAEAEAGRCD